MKKLNQLTLEQLFKLSFEEIQMVKNFEYLSPGEKAEIEQVLRHRLKVEGL